MINNDSILNQLNNYKKLNNAGVGITMRSYPTYVERYYPITTDIDTYKLIDVQIKKHDDALYTSLNKKTFTMRNYSDYHGDWTYNPTVWDSSELTPYKPNNIQVSEINDVYFYEHEIELSTAENSEFNHLKNYFKYNVVHDVYRYNLPYTDESTPEGDYAIADTILNIPSVFDLNIIYTKNNETKNAVVTIKMPFVLSLYGWQSYKYTSEHNITNVSIDITDDSDVTSNFYCGSNDVTTTYNLEVGSNPQRYGFIPTWYTFVAQNIIGAFSNFNIIADNTNVFSFNLAFSLAAVESPFSQLS